MDHDQNFKNLILDYPLDALEFFAAKEASGIKEQVRILPIREEQLKKKLGDRFRELDVPILVEWLDGIREAILFVLEEETDPRRFSIHRLAHYCLDLSELFKINRVVPVVIFLYSNNCPRQLEFFGDEQTYLSFEYLSCVFADLAYEHYRESQNIVARVNLPNMSYEPDQRVDVYADSLKGLREMEPDPEKVIKYWDFIEMYCSLDENERKVYYQKYPEEGEIMLRYTERIRQEGRKEEARDMLLQALEAKFNTVPEALKDRIKSLDDPPKLKMLHRVAVLSKDLREFEQKLGQ
jgi:molybdopterin-biosynthesis enzyme MoeA-like protein